MITVAKRNDNFYRVRVVLINFFELQHLITNFVFITTIEDGIFSGSIGLGHNKSGGRATAFKYLAATVATDEEITHRILSGWRNWGSV